MNRQADTQFTHTQKYRQTKRDRDGCIERDRQTDYEGQKVN